MQIITVTKASKLKALRERRERECFTVINRGMAWYFTLTNEQIVELTNWYMKWLDVTETFVIPEPPTWINNKVTQGDFIL